MEQELKDACEQIKELSDAFSTAQDQLVKLQAEKMIQMDIKREVGTQTKNHKVYSIGIQSEATIDDEIPKFKHTESECVVEKILEMPQLPNAAFETVYHRRCVEAETSFEASHLIPQEHYSVDPH